jgi:hypothetical protein
MMSTVMRTGHIRQYNVSRLILRAPVHSAAHPPPTEIERNIQRSLAQLSLFVSSSTEKKIASSVDMATREGRISRSTDFVTNKHASCLAY